MNRAQNRIYRMIENFKENLINENKTIGEYFQVPIKITIDDSDVLNILCKFDFSEALVKFDIPFELNCLILSYLHKPSFGEFKIIIPNDYPFKPPIWKLIKSNNKKYKAAEIYQNGRYRESWETSISFEKDILYMIELI